MELTVLVRFEPVTNYIGNEMQQAIIVRGNTESDCYYAARKRCTAICKEIRRDNCGDPTYSWVKEFWDKDVPVDLWDETQDPAEERTAPFVDLLEELTATSTLLKSNDVETVIDPDVKDVVPFLGDDDHLFDDGSNPFEDDDDHLF